MRILKLRFKNLNSLAGEWSIDFTHPAYVSSGIFAITGPTGSGKTTILDAICLALYGQTPRLKTISKSTNEIMTRNAAECFAEVEFESQVGRFVCHWSQRRAHKKPEGELQPPKHEIADQASGKVLENKLQRVAERVIQTTGLDFTQFTRSILLAQGDFAAFLNANPDERAPILEKITGTAIYSDISKKVHERNTLEAGKRNELQERIGILDILSPEEVAALKRTSEEIGEAIRKKSSERDSIRKAAEWLQQISRLEAEIEDLAVENRLLEVKRSDAASDLALLARAKKCQPYEETYRDLTSSRKLSETYESEIGAAREQLDGTQVSYMASLKAYESARQRYESLKAAAEEEKQVLIRVRNLDTRIQEIKDQIAEKKIELKKGEASLQQCTRNITKENERDKEKKAELTRANTYLEEHPKDSLLREILSGLGEKMRHYEQLTRRLLSNRDQLASQSAEVERLKKAHEAQRTLLEEKDREFQEATAAVRMIEETAVQLLDYRESGFWQSCVVSLKERRIKLEAELKIHDAIEQIGVKIREREEHQAQMREEIAKKREILSGLIREQDLKEEIRARIETNLALLHRIESLEEARSHLVEGDPCPLCGSPDHPYVRGTIPRMDRVKSEWEEIREELRMLSDQIRQRELSLSQSETTLSSDIRAVTEQKDRIRELLDDSVLGFEDMGFVTNSSLLKKSLSHALTLCEVHSAWCSDIVASYEGIVPRLKDASDAATRIKESLSSHQIALGNLDISLKIRSNTLYELEQQVASDAEELARLYQEVAAELHAFGIAFTEGTSIAGILESLEKRKREFEKMAKRKTDIEKEIDLIAGTIQNHQKQMEDTRVAVASQLQGISEKEGVFVALDRERKELFGTKDPDREEKRSAEELRSAEEQFREASSTSKEYETRIKTLQEQIEKKSGTLEQILITVRDHTSAFLAGIQKAGFLGEEEFITSRMPRDRFEVLEKRETDLVFEERDLSSRIKERMTALSYERSLNLTDKSPDTLEEKISSLESDMSGLNQEQGGIRQKVIDHEALVAQQNELLLVLRKQEAECLRWEKLHDLIGSSDGKKFRVFAQGLTFDRLIAHANRHLRKMSDRYLLIRGGRSSLDLDIMDNYQAGEIRSTKNLSGGESFIVSLALALGLSGMASRNVRIDSLFLDEGFGTLDSETLEVALETLATLQQEGKIIGIISHVPALKERISTKIIVEKMTGGKSRLKAPGCRAPGTS